MFTSPDKEVKRAQQLLDVIKKFVVYFFYRLQRWDADTSFFCAHRGVTPSSGSVNVNFIGVRALFDAALNTEVPKEGEWVDMTLLSQQTFLANISSCMPQPHWRNLVKQLFINAAEHTEWKNDHQDLAFKVNVFAVKESGVLEVSTTTYTSRLDDKPVEVQKTQQSATLPFSSGVDSNLPPFIQKMLQACETQVEKAKENLEEAHAQTLETQVTSLSQQLEEAHNRTDKLNTDLERSEAKVSLLLQQLEDAHRHSEELVTDLQKARLEMEALAEELRRPEEGGLQLRQGPCVLGAPVAIESLSSQVLTITAQFEGEMKAQVEEERTQKFDCIQRVAILEAEITRLQRQITSTNSQFAHRQT